MSRLTFAIRPPYSLSATAWQLQMGAGDPCCRVRRDRATVVLATPDGDVVLTAATQSEELAVEVEGPGAAWIQPHVEGVLGLRDDPSGFDPQGPLRRLWARRAGLRLTRLPRVAHRLVQIILQQLVSWNDAFASWRALVREHGSPAPGADDLWAPPSMECLRRLPEHEYVACGVLHRQARLIRIVAGQAARIERAAEQGADALRQRLLSISGIGEWTVQYLLGTALAEPDALLSGDYNLPHTVAYVLTGRERSDDAEMERLLEPYRGHRFRVISLLLQSDVQAPRRGPRRSSRHRRLGPR